MSFIPSVSPALGIYQPSSLSEDSLEIRRWGILRKSSKKNPEIFKPDQKYRALIYTSQYVGL